MNHSQLIACKAPLPWVRDRVRLPRDGHAVTGLEPITAGLEGGIHLDREGSLLASLVVHLRGGDRVGPGLGFGG